MSHSPVHRKSRRNLTAFAHTPSRLSHSTSARDLQQELDDDEKPEAGSSFTFQDGPAYSTPPRQTTTRRHQATATDDRPATPRTPEIHYSPFATSTPPSGLSRSTSIPFDMAASVKAGKQAETRRTELEGTPVPRKKRIIRRKPLWQKISEMPQRIIDSVLLQYPPSIEDALPTAHLANPIAFALHVVHWILLAPLFSLNTPADSGSILSDSSSGSVGSRWGGEENGNGGHSWKKLLVTLLLILLASLNSVYLFTRFRIYDMQMRSGQAPPISPHASPVAAPKAILSRDKDEEMSTGSQTPTQRYLQQVAQLALVIAKWSYYALLSIFGQQSNRVGNKSGFRGDTIQRLEVWEPPEFCLAFFCAYPPSAPLLSHFLTDLHPFITPILHLIPSFLLSHLAHSYAQLVKDRMLLSAEVMREYDQRFVYKRIFSSRVDRGVGTHEAPWNET